ncbi:hypothetical protein COY28_02015 [Candidatus Woesearchaeota archaeon CG_4_10_14_0_2_um_filter_57_5]|nr:MAG: hypothetical protein AUJ68_03165 [Candidatus Woesearchaeota archaeon CG1_02_57_44]PIZ55275.1 MAG: hypothetical protein COY28_02015 [Candidatus Woesearchaeota archaeon CG_4_10_14_0_2_um_filter_57_5]
MYFTMDALMAAVLLIGTVLLVSQLTTHRTGTEHISFVAEDLLNALQSVPVKDLQSSFVQSEIASGSIVDPNRSVMEQAGEYWATGQPGKAQTLLSEFINNQSVESYGVLVSLTSDTGNGVQAGDGLLYNRTRQNTLTSIASHRMISGVKQLGPNESIRGTTSVGQLRKATGQRTCSYLTIGGFAGQGNISAFLDLPSDITGQTLADLSLMIDADDPYQLLINGQTCQWITQVNTSALGEWHNITSCAPLILGDQVNLSIRFMDTLDTAYIAGGQLRACYRSQTVPNASTTIVRRWLPSVQGIANIYDGIGVPGTLLSLSAHLHFSTNYTSYLTLGNEPVYTGRENLSEQTIILDDTNFSTLNYTALSNTTIPFRFAAYNTTYSIINGTSADVVLITDTSGSMDWRIGYDNTVSGKNIKNLSACTDAFLGNDTSARLDVAACLDANFTRFIMNYSGNRLWLVDYATSSNYYYSSNLSLLTPNNLLGQIEQRYINGSGNGNTCTCCAINKAYEVLADHSTTERSVLLMSDGEPNLCCGRTQVCHPVYWWWCWYECADGNSTTGYSASCPGGGSACYKDAAVNATRRLRQDLNATIHAVGLGPLEDNAYANATLTQIAQAGNGTVFISHNGSELSVHYAAIASQILSGITQSAQVAVVSNGTLMPTHLFGDSYLEAVIDPGISAQQANELALTLETQFSGCDASIAIPPGVRVQDASVLSFSGIHWTDLLIVNDQIAYNLSAYGNNYQVMGDPSLISIPAAFLGTGSNTIALRFGDSPTNSTSCGQNSTLRYTLLISTATPRSDVLPRAEGCTWTVAYEDGSQGTVLVPAEYNGTNTCLYTPASITYDHNDAYQAIMADVLDQFDFDDDGEVLVNFAAYDIVISTNSISNIPYLWGPSLFTIEVGR